MEVHLYVDGAKFKEMEVIMAITTRNSIKKDARGRVTTRSSPESDEEGRQKS